MSFTMEIVAYSPHLIITFNVFNIFISFIWCWTGRRNADKTPPIFTFILDNVIFDWSWRLSPCEQLPGDTRDKNILPLSLPLSYPYPYPYQVVPEEIFLIMCEHKWVKPHRHQPQRKFEGLKKSQHLCFLCVSSCETLENSTITIIFSFLLSSVTRNI